MVRLKTSKEKALVRKKKQEEEYTKIAKRFYELTESGERVSDAVNYCANEFNCSVPKIYTARKYYDEITSTN